jgi:hypothetical protein
VEVALLLSLSLQPEQGLLCYKKNKNRF